MLRQRLEERQVWNNEKKYICGNDDYMVKLVELDELLLRVKALLRSQMRVYTG